MAIMKGKQVYVNMGSFTNQKGNGEYYFVKGLVSDYTPTTTRVRKELKGGFAGSPEWVEESLEVEEGSVLIEGYPYRINLSEVFLTLPTSEQMDGSDVLLVPLERYLPAKCLETVEEFVIKCVVMRKTTFVRAKESIEILYKWEMTFPKNATFSWTDVNMSPEEVRKIFIKHLVFERA